MDLAGNVIAGQSLIIPTVNSTPANQTFTFSGQIHALRFIHTANIVGALPIDDLTFGAVTPAPEPSTVLLIGSGFVL